jgi:hypothetical protein
MAFDVRPIARVVLESRVGGHQATGYTLAWKYLAFTVG